MTSQLQRKDVCCDAAREATVVRWNGLNNCMQCHACGQRWVISSMPVSRPSAQGTGDAHTTATGDFSTVVQLLGEPVRFVTVGELHEMAWNYMRERDAALARAEKAEADLKRIRLSLTATNPINGDYALLLSEIAKNVSYWRGKDFCLPDERDRREASSHIATMDYLIKEAVITSPDKGAP